MSSEVPGPPPTTSASSPLASLRHSDAAVRVSACNQIAQDPAAVVYIDAIAEALGDADRQVRRAAADALFALSREHDVVTATKRELHGSRAEARWAAAFTLSRIAPPEPALLPAAVEAFASPHGDVRWAAARLVVDLGRLHDNVLPVALGLAAPSATSGQSPAPAVRRMALFCLRELAPDEPAVVDAVLQCLRDGAAPGVDAAELRRAALTCAPALTGPLEERAQLAEALADCGASDPDETCRKLAGLALATWARQDAATNTHEE